jgi:hypothetical protein
MRGAAGRGTGAPLGAAGPDGACENGNPVRGGAAGALDAGAVAAGAGTADTAPETCGLAGALGAAGAEPSALGIGLRLMPESSASTCARDGCGGVGIVIAGRGGSGAGAAAAL